MKIYTGYFAQLKKYEEAGLLPIAICGKCPDWYKGLTYRELAPRKDWFFKWKKEGLSEEWYIKKYQETVLDDLLRSHVLAELDETSYHHDNKDIILLCYEAPGKFCHRHLLAQWLNTWFNDKNDWIVEYPL